MKSGNPALDVLCKASWVVTALVSLNRGLGALGFDFFQTDLFNNTLGGLATPLNYLIGLAGLYSLVSFVMHCTGKCDS